MARTDTIGRSADGGGSHALPKLAELVLERGLERGIPGQCPADGGRIVCCPQLLQLLAQLLDQPALVLP